MSCLSSSYKTIHVSPSGKDHSYASDGQAACLTHDQGQTVGHELSLMEMPEVEYTHFQHLLQPVETQAVPKLRSPPAEVILQYASRSTVISPFNSVQAIDLSVCTDEQKSLMMPGEKTPSSHGEIPGFVLSRVQSADSPREPSPNSRTSTQKRSGMAARVCLETRFKSMSADTSRQQDIQSTVLSNFLIFQQSAEPKETVIHPQMCNWLKPDKENVYDVSTAYVGSAFNPVTNMCAQVISHIPQTVKPKHQSLIIPKRLSFNFCPERPVKKSQCTSGSGSAEEQQLVNIENVLTTAASRKQGSTYAAQLRKAAIAAVDSAGLSGRSNRNKTRLHMSPSQRRERHNCKERERRKSIRLCCDKLNTLVPFCNSDTDKVKTLQWTAAFLRFINNTYGDTFKEEFERAVCEKKGLILNSSPSSSPDPMQRETDESLCIPLAVEQ